MKKFLTILLFLTSICFTKELILHFDLNKTILAKDSAEGMGKSEIFSILFARKYKGLWDERVKEPITFAKYVYDYLLPGRKGDKSLKQKRVNLEANFINFLKEINHPLYFEISKEYEKLLKKLDREDFEIFPSFYKLIDHLFEKKQKFRVFFRTFGNDLQSVIDEISKKYLDVEYLDIKFEEKGFFKNGVLYFKGHYYNSFDEQYKVLHKSNNWLALRDDWAYWMENDLKQDFCKRFIIDSSDREIVELFFDDNVITKKNPTLNIVAPYDISKGKAEKVYDLIAKKQIFRVDPLEAIMDDDYFINLVKEMLD
jgi:hypothetical protein